MACLAAMRGSAERTCSKNSSRPPRARTRVISLRAACSSGTLRTAKVTTAVSNEASGNGSWSAVTSRICASRPSCGPPTQPPTHVRVGLDQRQPGDGWRVCVRFSPLPTPISIVASVAWASRSCRCSRSPAASDAVVDAAELAAIGRGYVRFGVGHPAHFEVMFRLDSLDPDDADFVAASEAAYGLLTATVERCRAADRPTERSAEVVAVGAWPLVHGLSALWISGRLAERIAEQDPGRRAAAVSDLFIEAVLPQPGGAISADSARIIARPDAGFVD